MYQTKVNGKSFEVTKSEESILIDGDPFQWDLVKISEGYFHILYKNKSYRAEVVRADRATKTFHLKINNNLQVVEVKDKFDLLLEKMGMTNGSAAKINHIKAPMPGLVIDLRVRAGDAVKAGDPLLILEAMKMENILKVAAEATVRTVKVKKGDSVEKGQVLIEF
ncbi:MAG TPA: acetyl-CoA carboxylase biotin carboxyl carrier protein subunit [Cyclobacteriaceae bacterium]|nr:acetyl-CoA carboxylase biotin carboxyl carrier protein subunit [Cyclobacteriaceae bacterium]